MTEPSSSCDHCGKAIRNPKPSQRFCSVNCRVAAHRLNGKSTPAEVMGIHPRKGGGLTVVVRVTESVSARPRAWAPGQAVELLERDE